MMMLLAMLASPPPLPPESEARRVIERQLQAHPREDAELSAEEATLIRQRYLDSIGRRVERAEERQ